MSAGQIVIQVSMSNLIRLGLAWIGGVGKSAGQIAIQV